MENKKYDEFLDRIVNEAKEYQEITTGYKKHYYSFEKVIDLKRYSSNNSILLAEIMVNDKEKVLFRTLKQNYFIYHSIGLRYEIEPISLRYAAKLYLQKSTNRKVSFGVAFPGVKIEDA